MYQVNKPEKRFSHTTICKTTDSRRTKDSLTTSYFVGLGAGGSAVESFGRVCMNIGHNGRYQYSEFSV